MKAAAGFKVLLSLLNKFGKLDFNNLVKTYPQTYLIGRSITHTELNLGANFPPDSINQILVSCIRNINTIETDLDNIKTLVDFIHNEGANLSPETMLALFKNPNANSLSKIDIVKKVFKAMISIANMGGPTEIQKKYGKLVQELIKSKLVKPGIYKKIKFVLNVFNSGQVINPSNSAFKEILTIVNEVDTELNAIQMADTYKEMFANYEQKNPELFKLDMKVNNRLRFRVLKDRDPRHLRVGLETDCCQRIGGVGETAARDSFINPLAGILILEWFNYNQEWVLLTQSYFHYVEKDKGYILDNVEANAKNVRDSGVSLPEVYGWYADKMKTKLKINYFLAGKGYSELDTSRFGTDKRDEDPRYFSPNSLTKDRNSHYTDYKKNNGMDLLTPLFEVKDLNPNTWGIVQDAPTAPAKTANIQQMIRKNILYSYAISA
jgi:hypothetical protein